MKKIILTLCGAVVLAGAATSCSKSNVGAEEQVLADSLSIVYGHLAGADFNQRQAQMATMNPDRNIDKKAFLKGLETVLSVDTANTSYLDGLQAGMQLYGLIPFAQKAGVPVDPKALLKNFQEYYLNDSVDQEELRANQELLNLLAQRLNEVSERNENERLLNSEEGKANAEAAKKAVEEALEDGFTQTESGLLVKITNPGDSVKIQESDRVRMFYKGTHLNGEVFDQTLEEPATLVPARTVPGFKEGLQMLGNGGSAILLVPADLAYGVKGTGNIGVNEMLRFEITVDAINPDEEAK